MKNIVFILNEKTNDWQYKDLTITELQKIHQWKLMTGTESIVFDSIYDVINNLFQKDCFVTFKLPESMEDIPSSCNNIC